jgi:diguanylate cyclase (GGDEF)-like protein
MLGKILRRLSRAALIAFGGWSVLSLLLVGGTVGSLMEAEHTQTSAVLARVDAGAAAVEQTVLRLFDAVKAIQGLAQTRLLLGQNGDEAGRHAIDQEMHDIVAAHRFGVQDVSVILNGQLAWTSITPSVSGNTAGTTPPVDDPSEAAEDLAAADAPQLGAPVYDALNHRWSVQTSWSLRDPAGKLAGQLVVWLDPIALSDAIRAETTGDNVVSTVQRRSDGAFLARSSNPARAMQEHPSRTDPAFLLALQTGSGHLQDRAGGVDRLVGFRAPEQVPIVVSQSLDTQVALADFFRLRRIVLSVMLALIAGAFTATRLILANYLLRERLAKQAMLDPLTGLFNRRFFTDVMARRFELARHEGLSAAMLLIDLDGFKQVNDTRGHPVGDALLGQVAARLRLCCGPDDLVMRLGGDEFAVVRLCRQQRRDATSLARFIVGELARTFEVDEYHLRISASVGVSLYPSGGNALNDLLRSADIALYFVKADGGDAYRIFDPAMEETVRTRRALEVDLREALNRGQLEVYYQPLVQLEPRRVSGFEALLRWHHPVLGMVMPSRFIPIAEETGLIASIGEWVLRQACQEATRWPANTRLAVNLSPVQFERSDIVDIVASALRESRLEPRRLELEITEGVVMRDVGDVLATMRRLQTLGVRLALDDFGTGYSSLSYLRSFPFDKVKIDASFLADLHGDGGTIIRAVLGLCGHLHLDSLVEGVETEEQLSWLRIEGCTEVQGHLFSPPRPAGGVPEVIANVAARIPAALMRSYAGE